jgi:hypothetical protein
MTKEDKLLVYYLFEAFKILRLGIDRGLTDEDGNTRICPCDLIQDIQGRSVEHVRQTRRGLVDQHHHDLESEF